MNTIWHCRAMQSKPPYIVLFTIPPIPPCESVIMGIICDTLRNIIFQKRLTFAQTMLKNSL